MAMRERNVAEMKKNGKVVLLKADPQTILDRVKDSDELAFEWSQECRVYCGFNGSRRAKYEAAADIVFRLTARVPLRFARK